MPKVIKMIEDIIVRFCAHCNRTNDLLYWMLDLIHRDEGYFIKGKWYCSKECVNAANVLNLDDMWWNKY